MKNKIFKICLLFVTILSAFSIVLSANEEKNFIQKTQEEYQKGKYGAFLNAFNDEYTEAEKEGVAGQTGILNRAYQGILESNKAITDRQREALQFLDSLKNRVPETGSNTPENQLAAIEAEYALNTSLWLKNRTPTLDVKKQLAIEFEKLDKMEAIAGTFQDPKWKTMIQDAKKGIEGAYLEEKVRDAMQ